jgi:hypothetical protein
MPRMSANSVNPTPSAEPFLATDEQRVPRLGGATGKGWMPGRSGNPRGRAPAPVDIAALARVHGPKCIEVAVELLDDPDSRVRLAALVTLLDRGFGKPVPMLATPPDNSPLLLHFRAAQRVSEEIIGRMEQNTINGHAEPTNGHAEGSGQPVDLLAAPPPTE